MKLNIPRPRWNKRGYWMQQLEHTKIGKFFEAPKRKQSNIISCAKRFGYAVKTRGCPKNAAIIRVYRTA